MPPASCLLPHPSCMHRCHLPKRCTVGVCRWWDVQPRPIAASRPRGLASSLSPSSWQRNSSASVEIARIIEVGVRDSQAIDTEALCILGGEKVGFSRGINEFARFEGGDGSCCDLAVAPDRSGPASRLLWASYVVVEGSPQFCRSRRGQILSCHVFWSQQKSGHF